MNQHLEVKTITTNDIGVTIMIDYDRGTVGLVHKEGDFEGNWKPKKYVFAGRELNYMNGWLNILGAMEVAVKEGKRLLEKDLAEKSAFKDGLTIRVFGWNEEDIKPKRKIKSKSEARRIKIMKEEKKKK